MHDFDFVVLLQAMRAEVAPGNDSAVDLDGNAPVLHAEFREQIGDGGTVPNRSPLSVESNAHGTRR